ncbi:MAG: hypothetical protein HRT94_05145 [Alphaproteobacteria bacterium]|nr:hypothetical protein [Alphaproteobacteria bacterium]
MSVWFPWGKVEPHHRGKTVGELKTVFLEKGATDQSFVLIRSDDTEKNKNGFETSKLGELPQEAIYWGRTYRHNDYFNQKPGSGTVMPVFTIPTANL